jgi:preprotein translocase subunit YajC
MTSVPLPASLLSLSLLQLPTSANPLLGSVFMYGAIFAIFYFILIRPQQRQRKQHELLVANLKKGDEVVTAGGVVGEVVHIKPLTEGQQSQEDRVTIKSAESRLVVERGRITRIVSAGSSTSTTAA